MVFGYGKHYDYQYAIRLSDPSNRVMAQQDVSLQTAQAWCDSYNIDTSQFDSGDIIRTYRLFSNIDFGIADRSMWGQLVHSVLPYRHFMAVDQTDLGCVSDPQYKFTLELHDESPMPQRPIKYSSDQRSWINSYCKELIDKGVIRRIADSNFSSPVVLVPEAQSGQSYRFCINYKKLNARTKKVQAELPDIQDILDSLASSRVFTSLDLKAGFHNIEVEESSQEYTTFITQDGQYCWLRLPFGLAGAPHHFQKTIKAIIQVGAEDFVVVYLDDICIHGNDVLSVWNHTVDVIRKLAECGFMINVGKSKFLRDNITILGYELGQGAIYPNKKKVQLVIEGAQPTSVKSVQSLLGLLIYFRRFVPNFKSKVKPIQDILRSEQAAWTSDCSSALQDIAMELASGASLALPQPSEPFLLRLHCGESTLAGVLMQHSKPVAYLSRDITSAELQSTSAELYLLALHYCLQKIRPYVMYCPELIVESSEPALGPLAKKDNLHPKLAVIVADLSQYPISKYIVKPTASTQLAEREVTAVEDVQVLSVPRPKGTTSKPLEDFRYHIYFDGSHKRTTRSSGGGFVVFCDNQEIVRGGDQLFLASNNEAEGQAAFNALTFFLEKVYDGESTFAIVGDSQLIVRFFTREYRPKKDFLYNIVEQTRTLLHKFRGKFQFFSLPRTSNAIADECANQARESGSFVIFADEFLETQDRNCIVRSEDEIMSKPCLVCSELGNSTGDDMVLCDQCNRAAHVRCVQLDLQYHKGFWYCKDCHRHQYEQGTYDITQDHSLMHYLFYNEFPVGLSSVEQDRVLEIATKYQVVGQQLYLISDEGTLREIPSLAERLVIIAREHEMLGHPGWNRLYQTLRLQYYWPLMKQDVMHFTAQCIGCRGENVSYKLHPTLTTTVKPTMPFQAWSIDLITGLKPPSEGSEKLSGSNVVVCVDYFSKWVELGVLPDRSAASVARWFHFNIVCRFGRPLWVRCDQGREFMGAFSAMLKGLGVTLKVITPRHPRGNGLVERYNRAIKVSIRKLVLTHPSTVWEDWLGEIALGLRIGFTRSHGHSPYFVALKQMPLLPSRLQHLNEPEQWDIEAFTEAELVDRMVLLFTAVRDSANSRLLANDDKYKRYYAASVALSQKGIDFVLEKGDSVLVRQRKIGKLLPRTEGIWTFDRYGKSFATAYIKDARGVTHHLNVEEILPASS